MRIDFDDIDKGILKLLQDDARIPYAEMAQRLGVAESTIRYRLKRLLESKVITRLTALLDPRKIGMNVTSLIMVKINPKFLSDAIEQLSSLEEAHHVFQTTGEYDAIAVVHVKDMRHLNELKRRVKMIPGVEDASVWVTTGLIKVETRFNI